MIVSAITAHMLASVTRCAMKRAAVPSMLVVVVLFAVAVIAEAQQEKKVPRIGFDIRDAFLDGLRQVGYVEGQNLETGMMTDILAATKVVFGRFL
jgi:hypothetical protein